MFNCQNPSIEIRLAAGTDYTKFTTDDFDVDIVYGRPNQDGLVVLPLGEETVTPSLVRYSSPDTMHSVPLFSAIDVSAPSVIAPMVADDPPAVTENRLPPQAAKILP